MKLLFVANRVPYPPFRGDKLKIFNLAKRLCLRHELHLITFAQTREDLTYKAELEKIFKCVIFIWLPKWRSALNCFGALWSTMPVQVLYFNSWAMRRELKVILDGNHFDAVHVQHLRMAPYLSENHRLPRILDLPDAFSLYWERRKAIARGFAVRIFENIEQDRVRRYEKVIEQYDLALVCSHEDATWLEQMHHVDNLRVLPNGVDIDCFSDARHDYTHNSTILFTGNMDYAPNVDAVLYFTNEILPIVKRQFTNVKFIIAGQRPISSVQELASEDVVVTGFVKDLAAVYARASVVVAPLRFGAGTQNKVLEAMAMGVPVVCSNIGFAGLGIENGNGAFMEMNPKDFAAKVCFLLASPDARAKTGKAGRETVRQRFDWDVISRKLECYFKDVKRKHADTYPDA